MWPYFKASVSAADLLESGACIDGVARAVVALGLLVAPLDVAMKAAGCDRKYVESASNSNGSGSGNGDGYGDGSGDADGSGYGDGYGYGGGSGDGW